MKNLKYVCECVKKMITINKYVLLSIFGSPYKKGENQKNQKNIFRKKQKIIVVRRGYQRLEQLRTELNSSERIRTVL